MPARAGTWTASPATSAWLPGPTVRIALGASGRQVARLVLSRGFLLVGIGLAVGLVGAVGLARLIRGFMFEIAPSDPATSAG